MTTEQLEQLIEAQTERPNLDFKQDCKWDAREMAKDLIAMSNLRDGGHIVIGIREDGFNFIGEGVCTENIKSYKIDDIRDKMRKYAEPPVDIHVYYPFDTNGKQYVDIRVLPSKTLLRYRGSVFRENYKQICFTIAIVTVGLKALRSLMPAICKIFIIELAVTRLMQRRKNFGYIVESQELSLLEEEVDSIRVTSFIAKIKNMVIGIFDSNQSRLVTWEKPLIAWK